MSDNFIFTLTEIERKGVTVHQKEEWKSYRYGFPTRLYIGGSAVIPMSNGKYLSTSRVVDFEICNRIMVIETENSKYIFTVCE